MVSKFTIQFRIFMLLGFCLCNNIAIATDENQEILHTTTYNNDFEQYKESILLKQTEIMSNEDTDNTVKKENDNERMNLRTLKAMTRDHTAILNYLMENYMTEAHIIRIIDTYYRKTGPIATSWRDLNILLFDLILIIGMIYIFIIHLPWMDWIRNISMIFNWFRTKVQKQQNIQEQTPEMQEEHEKEELCQMLRQQIVV